MDYKELKEELIKANDSYYKENISLMSDYDFDMKMKQLEEMEKNQGFSDPDSPTQKPGSDKISNLNLDNKHSRKMASLQNSYNIDDVKKWYDDMIEATGNKNPEVVVNYKFDGMSGCFRYNNGECYKALSRGDGYSGESLDLCGKYLTDNVWNKVNFTGEVRGEIIMTIDGFNKINSHNTYQNARNLVSGSMKLLNLKDFKPRAQFIKFYAYWLENSNNSFYSEDLKELESRGFNVGKFYICKSLDEILEAIEKVKDDKIDVAIDGAVLKLNEKKYWSIIGETSKFPKYCLAYKYKQEEMETTVRKIEYCVGMTGKITPLCYFDPVFIDGSTIEKATLNNKEFMENMNVKIGSKILVRKAAAIIPQIVKVIDTSEEIETPSFPEYCPICGSKLEKIEESQKDYYCLNLNCPERICDLISNYTHALKIDGFADIVIEKIHSAGFLNSISDIYKLKNHKKELENLDRFGTKMVDNLLNEIENSKNQDLDKLITGLGIRNIGPKLARVLSKKFNSIENLKNASRTELMNINDIGEIVADSIIDYFKLDSNLKMLEELKNEGVRMESEIDKNQSEIFKGKIFCITGALSKPRNEYIKMIEDSGGKVSSSVSSKTNYLLTNDKNSGSSKNRDAQKYETLIINEDEFLKLNKDI